MEPNVNPEKLKNVMEEHPELREELTKLICKINSIVDGVMETENEKTIDGASPHGMHNYLYNWTNLLPTITTDETQNIVEEVQQSTDYYSPMLDDFNDASATKENLSVQKSTDYYQPMHNYLNDASESTSSIKEKVSVQQLTDYYSPMLDDFNDTSATKENLSVQKSTDYYQPMHNDFNDASASTSTSTTKENLLEQKSTDFYRPMLDNFNDALASTSTKKVLPKKNSPAKYEGKQMIKLTQVADSINYFDENGFVYSTNNTRELPSLYLRCKNSTLHKCPARAVAINKNLNNAVLTCVHNHQPEKTELCKTKFDKTMDRIYLENKFSTTREIYNKARNTITEEEALYVPEHRSYGSFMCRRKSEFIPKIPHSFDIFEELINDDKYRERYTYDSRSNVFYRGVYQTKHGHKMIVFISETALKKLGELKYIEMLMDGTFKILPRSINFSQLYIMSFLYEGRCYPFAYIFMEKRDESSYNLLFEILISLLPEGTVAKINRIMADYEKAVRASIRKYFPKARLSGCYFHFVKAIHKNAKRFGLSKDEKFKQSIKEVSCTALLPNDFVSKGFEYISNRFVQNFGESARWSRFESYWNRQWKNANISVFGLKNRTDNFQESFNKSTNLFSGRPHQNIWVVINTLKDIEREKADEIQKQELGKIFKKKSNKLMDDQNDKITVAMRTFEENQDIGKFLRTVTYQSELRNIFQIDDDFPSDDEGFFDDDEFDANDFRQTHNFHRNDADHLDADFYERHRDKDRKELPQNQPSRKRKASENNKFKKVALFRFH